MTDTITEFSDCYWRAAVEPDGKTWPFDKFRLRPCVPGFLLDQWCDTAIAKARLSYAPYNTLTERPLLLASLSRDDPTAMDMPFVLAFVRDAFHGLNVFLLITNKYLYCKGHKPISLENISSIRVEKEGFGTRYPGVTLVFPDNPVRANLTTLGIGRHLEALFFADFLERIRDRRFTVDKDEIAHMLDPSLNSSFVNGLKRFGVHHNALVEIRRSTSAEETIIGTIGTGKPEWGGFLILSNRRVIAISTQHPASEHCLLGNAPELHIEEICGRSGPGPQHTGHLHSHNHPVVSLLSIPAAYLIDKYKEKQYEESHPLYVIGYTVSFLLATAAGKKAINLEEIVSKFSVIEFMKIAEGAGVTIHCPPSLR